MNKELQFKIFANEDVSLEVINELNSIFSKGKISFTKDEVYFCYFSFKSIVVTNEKLFALFIDSKKEFDFIQIPLCRILRTFLHNKIVFDCSTEKRETLISLDLLIEDNNLNKIKELLEKINIPFNLNESIIYKHIDLRDESKNFTLHDEDIFVNEKMRKKFGFFSNSKYINKTISTNKEWFAKTVGERMGEKEMKESKININSKKNTNIFMGVDIDELIVKYTRDGVFLRNGCAKNLVELTGIDIDDAKEIIENAFEEPVIEEPKTSIKTSFDLNTYEPIPKKPDKPLSKKQRIKQNKKNGIVCCPKCGSTSITTTNKKLSVKRGLVGLAIHPLTGVVGAVTSKKIFNVCMNCGHRWKP